MVGKRSLGRAKVPPSRGLIGAVEVDKTIGLERLLTYPIDAPSAQTTGINANTSARFVGSVSSPIQLFMTPIKKKISVEYNATKGEIVTDISI